MRTREQLIEDTKPFSNAVIERVQAGGGRSADYVSWPHYAQRLLLSHGAHRYHVLSVVQGVQEVGRKDEKRQEVVWAVTVRVQFSDGEWYDGLGQGDTPTSAESNAYKRACAHAGIGLHLYGSNWVHTQLQADEPRVPTESDYEDAIDPYTGKEV